jgi:TonB family protein
VTVRVVVDETGKVIEAEALGDNYNFALRRAAERAAWRARFTPTLLSGVPVKVTGTIRYNFVLR